MRVISLLIALFGVAATAAEAPGTIHVREREIPLPAGASAELQASIKGFSGRSIEQVMQHPTTPGAWRAVIKAREQAQSAGIPKRAEALGVEYRKEVIDGVDAYWLEPEKVAKRKRLFIHVHGGAYVYGGGLANIGEALTIADALDMRAISVDYRMPPDHPFPAAVDDVVAVYRHLLDEYSPRRMAIGGTSAGGGLALAVVHKLKALNLKTPGAIYAGTAWADLTKTGDSLYTNEGIDRVLVMYDGSLQAAAELYANGHDMRDPLISPVYGEFAGFPPTIFITGTRDLFLSDVSRTHRKMRAAGVVADLHVFEGLSHAGYALSPGSPEHKETYREIGEFFDRHLK